MLLEGCNLEAEKSVIDEPMQEIRFSHENDHYGVI